MTADAIAFGWAGGGAPAWDPSSLTNLILWGRADTVLTSGGNVSQMTDKSGHGNHLVQATGANQPPLTASWTNGQPAIALDGVTLLWLKCAAFAGGTLVQPTSIIVVADFTGTAGNAYVIHDGVDGTNRNQVAFDTAPHLNMYAGTEVVSATGFTGPTLIMSSFDGSSSEQYFGSSLAQGPVNPGTAGIAGLTLGIHWGLSLDPWKGHIAEVIVVGHHLTSGDRSNLVTYSHNRYGT